MQRWPQGPWSHTQGALGSLLLPGEDTVPGAEPRAWSGAVGRRCLYHPESPTSTALSHL